MLLEAEAVEASTEEEEAEMTVVVLEPTAEAVAVEAQVLFQLEQHVTLLSTTVTVKL